MMRCPRCRNIEVAVDFCSCGFKFNEQKAEKIWRIEPFFFQGNLASAINNEILKHFKIEVVISLLTRTQFKKRKLEEWVPLKNGNTKHLIFDLHDNPVKEQLTLWKDCIIQSAEYIKNRQNTFVHCTAGVSRSAIASIFVYSYILEKRMTLTILGSFKLTT